MADSVDLQALLRDSKVAEVLDELDRELIGLKPVKTRIREIASLLVVEKAREALGVTGAPLSLPYYADSLARERDKVSWRSA